MSAEPANSPTYTTDPAIETLTPEQQATKLYSDGCEARHAGNTLKAYECMKKAIALNPWMPPYHLHLALVCQDIMRQGEHLAEEGWMHAQLAVKMAPKVLGNWIGLGDVALTSNKFHEAIAAFEHVISIDPKNAKIYKLCGFAYSRTNNMEMAKKYYLKCIELDPDNGDAHFLLSCIFSGDKADRWKQAFHGERGFLAKRPALLAVESKWNAAHGFLGLGDYRKGWEYFEARHVPNATNRGNVPAGMRFKVPMWNGQTHVADGSVHPATVRIHAEMGYGDVFLMARYLREVIDSGVKVIFESHMNMTRLMMHNFPEIRFVNYDTEMDFPCDYHLPIMSLPWVLKKFGAQWKGAYLAADPVMVEGWRNTLQLPKDDGLRQMQIGLCWASGKNSFDAGNHEMSRRKSLTFKQIEPLIANMGANFVSLQVERGEGMPQVGLADFADTAAVIANMDIVVSVDSAVANLAGAMGKPLVLLDRFDHDWRWANLSKPWFGPVRIYRQAASGDWDSVIERIIHDFGPACDKTVPEFSGMANAGTQSIH